MLKKCDDLPKSISNTCDKGHDLAESIFEINECLQNVLLSLPRVTKSIGDFCEPFFDIFEVSISLVQQETNELNNNLIVKLSGKELSRKTLLMVLFQQIQNLEFALFILAVLLIHQLQILLLM